MPPRNRLPASSGVARGILVLAFVCGVYPLAAQEELQLQRVYPGSGPFVCPTGDGLVEPSPQQRAQAGQLASEADNAVILGDYGRAEELLAQAVELDPTSADAAYNHARVLETLGRTPESMLGYCRAIALGASDVAILDAEERLSSLDAELRARISPNARQRFDDGLVLADGGYYPESVTAFTDALDELADWPEALYNRAVVLERMGLTQESLADYRRYLGLRPGEVDPQVAAVAQRIGMLEGLEAIPTPSPGNTLAFGVLFPGMGQYYSGRNLTGTIVLGAAVGAIATGFVFKKVTVRCLNSVPDGGDCPANEIVDESSERPLLAPALGAAAAVTVAGAVEAWLRARRRRAEQESGAASQPDGFGLSGPSLSTNGNRVDLSFLSLRFR